MAAKRAGAGEIVATDIHAGALSLARRCGADDALDVGGEADRLHEFAERTGRFDVHFEASGSVSGLRTGLDCLCPRGILVQMGMGGDVQLPITLMVTREVDLRGSFRFDEEFGLAARLISGREIDVRPLQTASFPMERAHEAFDLANDKSKSTKVLISFGSEDSARFDHACSRGRDAAGKHGGIGLRVDVAAGDDADDVAGQVRPRERRRQRRRARPFRHDLRLLEQ